MKIQSLLKQPFALQALVAIPSLMLAGKLFQKLINKDLEVKLLDIARD